MFCRWQKTVPNPTIFVKNAKKVPNPRCKKKKIQKWLVLVISVNFLRFSLKLLSRISEKDKNIRIGGNYVLSANSIKICLKGIFACRIHICDENSSKSYDFREKCKKIEKWLVLVKMKLFFRCFWKRRLIRVFLHAEIISAMKK